MIQRIETFMNQWHMLPENGRILVGFSGGADSLCLMEVLRELSRTHDLTLRAVHVHHGIRGKSADKDAAFVEDYCKKHAIDCQVYRVSAEDEARKYHIGLEEAGRQLRYRLFQKEAGEWDAGAVAVAHHRNDQAETMLFSMVRGSSLTGAGGIRPVQGRIIRPLLCTDRDEIRAFLRARKLSWREDVTNEDTVYTRNLIRKEVIPLLSQINTEAVSHMAALALDLQQTENYMQKQEDRLWNRLVKEEKDGLCLDNRLTEEDGLMLFRICYRAIVKSAGGARDITREHAKSVAALFAMPCGKTYTLPDGLKAWREKNGVCVGRQKAAFTDLAYRLSLDEPCFVGNWKVTLSLQTVKPGKITEKTYTKWVDYDKIKSNLILRRRQPEDVLCIDMAGHHKKLNRFLIDRKIPRHKRDSLWLFADGCHVVWIPGERLGAEYKVTEETKRVLEIKITGECEDE